MSFERLSNVEWGLLARASLRYSVLTVGVIVAITYGFSTVAAVDFGLLALLLVSVGIVMLVIAANVGPRTSTYAASIEPGAGSTPDLEGFVARPIGDATLKLVFVALGLIVWGGIAMVLVG